MSGAFVLRDHQRLHPPNQLQAAGHGWIRGNGQNRRCGTELADVLGCGPSFSEREDRRGVQLAGDGADGATQGIRHRAGQMAVNGTLGIILFDPAGDGRHRLNGFHWEIADGCFVGEHHCIGAIQNGVGHIAHFSAGGSRAGGHRIQHLGGRDDRNAQAVGFPDQFLLQKRMHLQ